MKESEIFDLLRLLPPEKRKSFLKRACVDDVALFHRLCNRLKDLEPNASTTSNAPDAPKAVISNCEIQEEDTLDTIPLNLENHSTNRAESTEHQSQSELNRSSMESNENRPSVPKSGSRTKRTGSGPGLAPGRWVGSYKLVKVLGRGGMGEVWLAEQEEPVKRQVALKVIKRGMGSRAILARFNAERQALALMSHPNIAQFYDAGSTSSEQSFFAMELVPGEPLNTYCDSKQLSIDDRLRLFMEICAGVHHAHQKGIIHRDLKPTNILVANHEGKPVVKVIDFGLAKAFATTQRLTTQSLATEIGQILGTPQYMSPEQAGLDPLDIDTRTDIYSLGVILYELLTGRTPLDGDTLKEKAILKVLQFIREIEPVKPSSRLSSSTDEQLSVITGDRKTDSGRLNRVLAGDLDWIVMKALDKDRTRRYDSASGFAEDVARYLANEPIVARPPSVDYKVRKFVRKNRAMVLAAAVLACAILVGFATSTAMMLRAQRAERLAAERLDEVIRSKNETEKERDAANLAREKSEEAQRNEVAQRELAEAATALKENALVEKEVALADQIRQREFAEAITEFVASDLLALTSAEGQSNFYEDATVSELSGETTLKDLLNRAAEKLKTRSDLEPEIEARLSSIIGESYRSWGEPKKGITFLQRALNLNQKQRGLKDPATLANLSDLALCLHSAGDLENALPLYEQALEARQLHLGLDHVDTLTSMNNLADAYRESNRLEDAIRLFNEAIVLHETHLGATDVLTLNCKGNLAACYFRFGEPEKALLLLTETLDLMQDSLPLGHPATLAVMSKLADFYRENDQLTKALPLYRQSLELLKTKLGDDHDATLAVMNNLAAGYRKNGQLEEALVLFQESMAKLVSKYGHEHPDVILSTLNLAECLYAKGQLQEAITHAEAAMTGLIKRNFMHEYPQEIVGLAVKIQEQADDFEKADSWREQWLEFIKRSTHREGADFQQKMETYTDGLTSYAVSLMARRSWPKAEKLLRESLRIHQRHHPEDWKTFHGQSLLGGLLLERANSSLRATEKTQLLDEAESLLTSGFEGLSRRQDTIPKHDLNLMPQALERLVQLHENLGKPERLEKYQQLRDQQNSKSN